jgi:hypothetical protein
VRRLLVPRPLAADQTRDLAHVVGVLHFRRVGGEESGALVGGPVRLGRCTRQRARGEPRRGGVSRTRSTDAFVECWWCEKERATVGGRMASTFVTRAWLGDPET